VRRSFSAGCIFLRLTDLGGEALEVRLSFDDAFKSCLSMFFRNPSRGGCDTDLDRGESGIPFSGFTGIEVVAFELSELALVAIALGELLDRVDFLGEVFLDGELPRDSVGEVVGDTLGEDGTLGEDEPLGEDGTLGEDEPDLVIDGSPTVVGVIDGPPLLPGDVVGDV